jgi:hypothetical protein
VVAMPWFDKLPPYLIIEAVLGRPETATSSRARLGLRDKHSVISASSSPIDHRLAQLSRRNLPEPATIREV